MIEQVFDEILPGYRERRVTDSTVAASATRTAPAGGIAASLVGAWSGHISTSHGPVPLDLLVDAVGTVRARLMHGGDVELTRVSFARHKQEIPQLRGRIPGGDVQMAEDVGPGPSDLYIELSLRGARLLGLATTYPRPDAPFGARLSFPIALERR